MVVHHRLENSLTRAEELITVGNQAAALQLLHDAIVSRWFQHNLMTLDAIMLKFVELCVELRRGRLAKDGLHQYRSVSQNVNVAGLETVIKHFLDASERKLEEAHGMAAVEETVEDLEQVPEETLASVWGNALGDERERTGRETVTPWLRFVWEVYRIILDICRHNAKLESLYRVIVERAFAFCRKYGRKAEFRRLSEILRHHLAIIIKFPTQPNGIILSEPTSHQLQLELRFEQLAVATDMELWHEAFRSIEDIHGLFVLARKSAKPALVMTYYERLGRVFQMSNNYLYLAATLCKLYSLSKSQNGESPSEQVSIDATLAVLAVIATPLLHEHDVTNTMTNEEAEAKNARLGYFLGMQKAPTRSGVIRDLYARAILSRADVTAQKLFSALEASNGDFELMAVEKALGEIQKNPNYSSFVPAIYRNVVALIFKRISQKGKVETFEALEKMIAMPSLEITTFNLDRFIIDGCRSGDFHLRIDHQSGIVKFKQPCFASPVKIELDSPKENKCLQIFTLIEETCKKLGSWIEQKPKVDIDELRSKARANLDTEHRANLGRKMLIERKKEVMEEIQQRKEREEARERAIKLQQEKETERIRMAEEASKREAARREAEREQIRRDQAQQRDEEEQRRKEAAARRANLEKMIAVVKRLDHLERAYRQEEIPLLATDYERQKKEDLAAYEERSRMIKEKSKTQYESDIQTKKSLAAMTEEYKKYVDGLLERRKFTLGEKQAKVKADLEAAKEARREKVRAQAMAKQEAEEERKAAIERDREEEEQQAIAAASAESAAKRYVPPNMRNAMPESAAARPSGFGARSGSSPFGGSSTGGGSWRRA